ncbi:MAG: hypothetical protein JKY96_08935 [Phycisphaerales bacterium]|nr:hypothetical protein [Phycisphaerales bacterium]
MLQLLKEIENIQEPQNVLTQGNDPSLEDLSASLAWGYITLGLDDNLSAFEIFDGLDNSEQAIEILQDESQDLPMPQTLRDLLNSVMEDMLNDLETQI